MITRGTPAEPVVGDHPDHEAGPKPPEAGDDERRGSMRPGSKRRERERKHAVEGSLVVLPQPTADFMGQVRGGSIGHAPTSWRRKIARPVGRSTARAQPGDLQHSD